MRSQQYIVNMSFDLSHRLGKLHRDQIGRIGRIVPQPDGLTFGHQAKVTNHLVPLNGHRQAYNGVQRDHPVTFQQDSAGPYILANSIELGHRFTGAEGYAHRVLQAEATMVPSLALGCTGYIVLMHRGLSARP